MFRAKHGGILESAIPLGGFGHTLTTTECRKLTALGLPCTERHIVVRTAVDTPWYGRLYAPTYTAERHAPTKFILG